MNTNERKRRIRQRMYKRQKGLCWLCGKRMSIAWAHAGQAHFATFDHLVPKADGGGNAQENLRLAHQKCNQRRADLPLVNVLIAAAQP